MTMRDQRNGSSAARRIIAFAAAVAMGFCLAIGAGCTSSRSSAAYTRPLPPKPRPLQPAPPDARANALVLNVSATPLDTNGNGYPDLIHATAHLFDTRYPPAIKEDGAFVFRLYAPGQSGLPDARMFNEWRIEGEALEEAHARSAFGECYRFRLSLLDGGTDRLPVNMADIKCWFEPADGRAATHAGEVASIRIGRRVLVPQLRWEESAESARRSGAVSGAPVLEPAK
jgi:hypothetical protein